MSKNKPQTQQSQAVRARWAAEEESEQAIQEFFRETDVEEGLALLARMRHNCDLASRELNQRISVDDAHATCHFCGGPRKPRRQWALVKPRRDPVTQLIVNEYYCDIFCVAMQNKKTQGIAVVSDRGAVKDEKGEPVSPQ